MQVCVLTFHLCLETSFLDKILITSFSIRHFYQVYVGIGG